MHEHPFRLAMRIRQEKINQEEDRIMKNDDERVRQSQAAKNFGQIQDIKRSDLYKTTTQHLQDIRKRELMQKRLHNTVNNMNSNQLDDFVKKTS